MKKLSYETEFKLFTGVVVLGALGLILFMVKDCRDYNQKHKDQYNGRVQACKILNPKYGNLYTAKVGPYRDTSMIATEFGVTTVVLLIKSTQTSIRLECSELRELK